MDVSRRSFLTAAASGLAFQGLAVAVAADAPPPSRGYRNEAVGYGPLLPDPRGVFDLPPGFSYLVVSQAGEPMSDGLVVPHKCDGMGCFPLGGSQVALVRNHEVTPDDHGLSAF